MRIAAFLLLTALAARAQVLTYPLAGNLRADEGTIEFFFRLEDEPDGTQARGCHYFPLFTVNFAGEERPRIQFSYQTIWSSNNFHFFFSSSGYLLGKLTGNPYITSVEDTQSITKADVGGKKYPRTPRLHKGDWHHLALTWTGAAPSTLNLYLDGNVSILSNTPPAALWDSWETATLSFMTYVHHDNFTLDDLRISAVARTQEECAAATANGALTTDKCTLLLDRFDAGTLGMIVQTNWVQFATGKTGNGLKILRPR